MKRPNFFLVGAPKCGTTALSEYLGEHPNIFMCEPKEPRYFADELDEIRAAHTLDEYLKLFENATEDHKAVGEASVWYLYFSESLGRIHDFDPQAKIVVMLRNPVDMVYALHSQCLYNHLEDQEDFRVAWELQQARAQGRSLPNGCPHWRTLMYRDIGMLGQQMERLYEFFPREQVLAIVHDDFRASNKQVYERTLAFLGVPSDGRETFEPANVNKRHRFRTLARMNKMTGGLWEKSAQFVRKTLGIKGPLGLRAKIMQMNTVVEVREPLDPAFRDRLTEEFADDIHKLGDILERNLSHWLKPHTQKTPA